MNKEQLQRGNDIQDLLRSLNVQLGSLQKYNNDLLRELTHNCSGKIDAELQDLEDHLKQMAVKIVKARIEALEREFKKL